METENMNKKVTFGKKAGVLAIATLFILVLFAGNVNAQLSFNYSTQLNPNGHVDTNITLSNQPPSWAQIIYSDSFQQQTNGSQSGGGKASIYTIEALRYLDQNFRLRLFGTICIEAVFFDGGDHHATNIGFVELWCDVNGTPAYGRVNFTIQHHWWGGPMLQPSVSGFYVVCPDRVHVVVNKIHVYVQRTVDNFYPDFYNKVFNKYIINDLSYTKSQLIQLSGVNVETGSSEVAKVIVMG
jgi:hypothetical protein